jgi:hypothetical protein
MVGLAREPPLKRDWAASDELLLAMPDDAPEIQINVPPELQVGVYANFATVSSQTEHDFNLDFIQLVPGDPGQPPEGHVVSRVKVGQGFLMPLLQALASHQTMIELSMREMREQQEGADPE